MKKIYYERRFYESVDDIKARLVKYQKLTGNKIHTAMG